LVLLLLNQLLPVYFVGRLILCLSAAPDECFCGGLRRSDIGANEPLAMNLQGLRERGD
jgi:hypothetical protein